MSLDMVRVDTVPWCERQAWSADAGAVYKPCRVHPLPQWLRTALSTTAAMNIGVAFLFLPPAGSLRALAGFPAEAPSVYLLTVGLFVALFGVAYLGLAVRGSADRLLMGISAAGKLAFFTLLVALWLAGTLPFRAPLIGSADLVFGAMFVAWLVGG
jgi:hypothetical protein